MKYKLFILGITVLGIGLSARAENSNSDMLIMQSDSITFATLDTAIDSDKSDSVTATILKGKHKGAQLQGSLTHVQGKPKQYQLIFTSMSFNHSPSIKITAYGIDPDTARTALASKVNDEYFNRNGTILSMSFLQSKSERYKTPLSSNHPNDEIMSSKVKINTGAKIGILFITEGS